MDPYYRYGISLAWDQAPQWGKRQKRSETLASKASPAVDWGEGYRPSSTPDSLVDFCFVFPPLWTWSHARILPRWYRKNKFSFWPYNQSFINQLVRSRRLDTGLVSDLDFVSVHKRARKNSANMQPSWPQAWSITHKCKSAVIPLPWGITILNQGKIHGKFREVKIRGGLCTVKSADARRYDQFRPLIHGRKFPKYYKWVCSVEFPFPETRYKLSVQRIPGSFGRTSVTYDRLMVALTTID